VLFISAVTSGWISLKEWVATAPSMNERLQVLADLAEGLIYLQHIKVRLTCISHVIVVEQ
jgi:hypothetical protein